MADEVTASPEKLRTGATRLTDLHTTLTDAVRAIDRAHTDLHATWTGDAASSMKTVWQREFDALVPLIDSLNDMAGKLTEAADSLQAQDQNTGDAVTDAAAPPLPGS